MTNEEKIKCLEGFRDYLCDGNPIWDVDKCREVFDEAISAMMDILNLPSGKIIYCKDCKYYCNILYQNTQFEYGDCDVLDNYYIEDVKPYGFCSRAIERK